MLKQCIRDMDADVYCFQEVLTGVRSLQQHKVHVPNTGCYAQDADLLGPLYAVYSCPAALVNLRQQGGLASMLAYTLDWLAHSRCVTCSARSTSHWVHSWLGPLVRAMPLRIEQFREVNHVHSDLVRLAR